MDYDINSQNGTLSPNKMSVKALEIAIEKFNGAVPHFVKIVKSHNNTVMKNLRINDWNEAQKEHMSATRTVNQLKNLLKEVDNLRKQVIDSDLKKFDVLVNDAKESAECALKSFQGITVKLKAVENQNYDSTKEEYNVASDQKLEFIANISEDIKRQEQIASSMERIQEDIQDVHYMFKELSQLVHEQGESVEKIEDQVEVTHVNVVEGERQLCQAVKYKKGAYPLMGALIGSCLGGPLGLIAGFKLGSLAAAIGCGLLGFTGGKFVKSQNQIVIDQAEQHRIKLEN